MVYYFLHLQYIKAVSYTHLYEDSKPGTLNDFLGAATEDDVRPEALYRLSLIHISQNMAAMLTGSEQNWRSFTRSCLLYTSHVYKRQVLYGVVTR